jgi:hypothetical protein
MYGFLGEDFEKEAVFFLLNLTFRTTDYELIEFKPPIFTHHHRRFGISVLACMFLKYLSEI